MTNSPILNPVLYLPISSNKSCPPPPPPPAPPPFTSNSANFGKVNLPIFEGGYHYVEQHNNRVQHLSQGIKIMYLAFLPITLPNSFLLSHRTQ